MQIGHSLHPITELSKHIKILSYSIPKKRKSVQSINTWYLSAPAHDNILLIRMTWKGCTRIRMWKASLPQFLTKYLLAQIRPASKASDDSCSYSSDTRWTHRGKSSTLAFFLPRSKIRILGSTKDGWGFCNKLMCTLIIDKFKHTWRNYNYI